MNLVGVDYFGHASLVVIDSAKATDATIEQVGRLSQLEEPRLGRSAVVGEAGVVHLKRLGTLNGLILIGSQINDTGLIHLKALRNLSRT